LHELAEYVWKQKDVDFALAVSADGDRMTLYDNEGHFIDSNKILLLLIHYLVKYKGQSGKVVVSFFCTNKMEQICSHYGLELVRTKSGFRHITDIMLNETILAGGDESGGITVGTYLPERDGVWIGMMIWSWLSESGKSLMELLSETEKITGPFAYERTDLLLNKNLRNKIMDKCKKGDFTEFGDNLVTKVDDLDGYKFHLGKDEWVLLKPLLLQPAIRIYAEAKDKVRVRDLISTVKKVLQSIK
jgi:phosphomannomutase